MNEVKCTIPADTLQFTVTALTELAIQKEAAAESCSAVAAESTDPETAEILKTAAVEHLERAGNARKAAEFYYNLLLRQRRTHEED